MNKLIYQGDWSVPVRKDFILSPDYSIGEKALYIALRSFCSPDQSAFPSSSLLAKGLGVGRDTIYKYAASLEEKGLISREQSRSDEPGESGKFSHTIYTLYDTTSPKLPSPHPKEPLSEKPQTEKTVTVKTDTNQYPYKEESISITNKGEAVLLRTESGTHAESWAGGTPVSPPPVPAPPSPKCDEIFREWNNQSVFPKCLVLSEPRRRSLEARLREPFFVQNWREAMAKIRKSSFCRGKNDRGWRADFDWFVKPGSVVKIMEGKYDDRTSGSASGPKMVCGVIRPF